MKFKFSIFLMLGSFLAPPAFADLRTSVEKGIQKEETSTHEKTAHSPSSGEKASAATATSEDLHTKTEDASAAGRQEIAASLSKKHPKRGHHRKPKNIIK